MKKDKKIKKLLVAAAAVVLLISAVSQNTYAAESEYLIKLNAQAGTSFTDGHVLTREEFCVVTSIVFCTEEEIIEAEGIELPFEDAAVIAPENVKYLKPLYRNGVLKGVARDGGLYMEPESAVTRQDAFTFLARVMSKSSEYRLAFSDADTIAPYAYSSVAWFTESGISQGFPDGTFQPTGNITAYQLAVLVSKTFSFNTINENILTTYAGSGGRGRLDGETSVARYLLPYGMLAKADGGLLVFDTYNNAVRVIYDGVTSTFTGSSLGTDSYGFPKGGYLDGDIDEALFNRPTAGVMKKNGDILVCDSANNAIRVISNGVVSTLCGGAAGYADGSVENAMFNNPMDIALDDAGNIYVADTLNHCIRKIDVNGVVTTIGGVSGNEGFNDGTASQALFRSPSGIAVTGDGKTIYVSDTGNHRIRMIENGTVSTFAGMTTEYDEDGDPFGGFADGPAEQARFCLPVGITLAGEIVIVADSGNNRVRAVTSAGEVITIAGNGEPGDVDTGAREAMICSPSGVCYVNGSLYITDSNNNKVKKMPFSSNILQ